PAGKRLDRVVAGNDGVDRDRHPSVCARPGPGIGVKLSAVCAVCPNLSLAERKALLGGREFGLFTQIESDLVAAVSTRVGLNRQVSFPIDQFGFGFFVAASEVYRAAHNCNMNLHGHIHGLTGKYQMRLVLLWPDNCLLLKTAANA